jgi:hypothetical protein
VLLAGSRSAKVLCQATRPVDVNDGTLNRAPTERPGPLVGVERWGLEDRLLEAARRAADHLPAESREQFLSLFSPASVAITGGVLVFWAASHAVGAGEVVDAIMLLAALLIVGWQVFHAGEEIGLFLKIAIQARTEDDLNEAGRHLADAVVTVGVTVFLALIHKAGTRLGGRVGQMAAARSAFWGRSVEEWLIALGKPKASPLEKEGLEVALKYLRARIGTLPVEKVEEFIEGMDLSKPVRRVVLPRGQEVITYGDPDKLGLFYTKPGTPPSRAGINALGREHIRFQLEESIEALESTAISVDDTWADKQMRVLQQSDGTPYRLPDGSPAAIAKKFPTRGGGVQYLIPNMQALKNAGAIRIVPRP